MHNKMTEISVKGCIRKVPSFHVGSREIIFSGRWPSIASVKDEAWMEGEAVSDPEDVLDRIKQSGLKADIFTFAQKPFNTSPQYRYPMDWDNLAVLSTSDFEFWWGQLPKESRKNVRRSRKRGVVVQEIPFSDELVKGIVKINNDAPIRQGKPFWHYGKGFDIVKKEYATFLDRCAFIGAYHENTLIGFIKMIFVGDSAGILQLLCLQSHYDKRPANALIAKAVEICCLKGVRHLTYGKYIYGKIKNSPLTEFKRRNGFKQVNFPRYYIPLSATGWFFVKTGLHHGWKFFIPQYIQELAIHGRKKWYQIKNMHDDGNTDE